MSPDRDPFGSDGMDILRMDRNVPPRCGQHARVTSGWKELSKAGTGWGRGLQAPGRVGVWRLGPPGLWLGSHPAHLGQGHCPNCTRARPKFFTKKRSFCELEGKSRQLIKIGGFVHRKAQEKYFGKERSRNFGKEEPRELKKPKNTHHAAKKQPLPDVVQVAQ